MKNKLIGAGMVAAGSVFYATDLVLFSDELVAFDEKIENAKTRKERNKVKALRVASGVRAFTCGVIGGLLIEGGIVLMKM